MIFLITLLLSHFTDLLRGLYGPFSISGRYLAKGHAQNDRKHRKVCLKKKQAIKQTDRKKPYIFQQKFNAHFRCKNGERYDTFRAELGAV